MTWYFTLPLIFTRLRQALLGMNRSDDRQIKERLHVFLWDEETEEWGYKGNGLQITEEPPAV